ARILCNYCAPYGMCCHCTTEALGCAPVEQQEDWASRLCRSVAGEVRRYRRERGLSAQQLADRCADLGMPGLGRMTIANLENGRRHSIALAEVLIRAAALDVAPAARASPVGYAAAVEYLPGQEAPPLDALDYFAGAGRDDESALALLRQH